MAPNDQYVSELGEAWSRARPESTNAYLDSAAAARSSRAVIGTISDHLWRESERGSYIAQEQAQGRLIRCRSDIARLVGRHEDEVIFRDSARAALRGLLTNWNLPISATVWVGLNEYGPTLAEFERRGYAVRPLPGVFPYDTVDLDALENMLQFEQPDFIHICHIGAHTGIAQPVNKIVRLAHSVNVPVVVDVAQAIGHRDCVTEADISYGTSRKWLAGPRGVGFLAANREAIRPVEVDTSMAFVAGQLGLATAIAEATSMGIRRVHDELARIGQYTRERLSGVASWEVIEQFDEPSAITTLAPPPGWTGEDVLRARDRLRDNGILVTAAEPWRAPLSSEQTLLRVSPHLDVTRGQLDRLASALRDMAY